MEHDKKFSLETFLAGIDFYHSRIAWEGASIDCVSDAKEIEIISLKTRLIAAEAMITIILSHLDDVTRTSITNTIGDGILNSAPIHGVDNAQIYLIIDYLQRAGLRLPASASDLMPKLTEK
ncbi:hypothetical protein FOT62_13705 [Serratia marcescens]|uniref:Uncharacterized protein n=1 Tax=Serratia marcescens TaxID=615 RepID=A0A5C7CFI4_SERMA|nr:hypothetical protein [Serratia marcescens]TXE33226.1 hypothetical protein FOT62_13705 [Serratia marcescens]TXE65250.1 hypothetical protein FOT56_08670 [Serratia marcescens]